MRIRWITLSVGLALATSAVAGEPAEATPIDFGREILPILADNCFECHGPDEHGRKADLRLDLAEAAYEMAVVPGDADASPLIERLLSHDKSEVMPPPESPRQPTKLQIQKLIRWVDEGAEYAEHWSFTNLQRSDLPSVQTTDWVRNEIDHFVFAQLQKRGLQPQPDAAPGTLARRLNLTVTGLPASNRSLDAFESTYSQDPDRAISDRVDALLDSQTFGEHFAWSWLDAARYADTNGYQGDGIREMWPWRDWLIRTLNANVPYDVMTKQMLAGDLLVHRAWDTADWIPDQEESDLLVATGFLRNHRYDTGSGTIPAESKFENAADRLETFGTVWMGLTLQCARCHTHKFDPIEQHEYYQLLDFFDNVPEVGSALKQASHPYIHVPGKEERAKLLQLRKDHDESVLRLQSSSEEIGQAQGDWEAEVADEIRVNRGLRHRFATEAIQFDGESEIPESSEPIELCAGDQEWTISFWFRPASIHTGAIFSSVEEPERYRPGIQADWVDGKVRMRHVCRWVNSYIEFESVKKLEPEKWYHVSFRCDGRMQGLAYTASIDGDDGAMRCTHPVTNDSAGNAGKAPLILGGSPLLPGFSGQLHDLRFYDRNLSQNEVVSLADRRSTSELAAVPLEQRTPAELSSLQLAFLESEALPDALAKLRDAVFESEKALKTAIKSTPTTMVMKEVDLGKTYVRPTGTYDTRGEDVIAGTPAFLGNPVSGRLDRVDLARWATDPRHPLTARVAVNRIWQMLWGRGFVDSPDNFGTQCAEPLHSDLLDWLAEEYIRLGWDTKALIKLIVTSRTWRQDSSAPGELWEDDPMNALLARGPRYRLPIQVVRDQALALSGRLDPIVGGPPVLLDAVKGKDEKPIKLPYEVSQRRRTIYSFWKRNGAHLCWQSLMLRIAINAMCERGGPTLHSRPW